MLFGNQASEGKKPGTPTIGTATAGTGSATVAYTAPTYTGKGGTVTYTATSNPGSLTGTGTSPITVSGLTNGTAYTFTVQASTVYGVSSDVSAPSNSVTPVASYSLALTATTTQNYTIPSGKTKLAVWIIGGGAASYAGLSTDGTATDGGLGAGISAFKDYSVSAGQTYLITIGSGGLGRTSINQSTSLMSGASSTFGNLATAVGPVWNSGIPGNGTNNVTGGTNGSGGNAGARGNPGFPAGTAGGAGGNGATITYTLDGLGSISYQAGGGGGGGGGGGQAVAGSNNTGTGANGAAGGNNGGTGGNGGNGILPSTRNAGNAGNAANSYGGGGGGSGGGGYAENVNVAYQANQGAGSSGYQGVAYVYVA